jgi:subtilisin family serine protease
MKGALVMRSVRQAMLRVGVGVSLLGGAAWGQSTGPGRGDPAVNPADPSARWIDAEDRGWGRPVLDPRIEHAFALRTMYGVTSPRFVRAPYFERTGEMPVVVRFVRAPGEATLRAWAARGVRWGRGGRPTVSGAFLASVSEEGAAALAADPSVGRVECDLFPRGPRPLNDSATETRVESARRAIFARDGVELDGRGVVIGDVDSSVFPFHPAFFHADGGVFEWRDVNGNGALDPGTDGVDLDRNGTIAPNEVLLVQFATTHDARLQRIMPATTVRPDMDWLYLDTNGNGQRDFAGDFAEDTPAYGEPLFVIDDANRDGTLGLTERLLRLKTSKFRAINSSEEFVRGGADSPLVGYPVRTDERGFSDALHATGVMGILAGGVPGVSRLLGLAPRAELVLTDYVGLGDNRDNGLVAGMQWVVDQGANVLVTEFAPYSSVTLDGSSEGEALLDAFADAGGVPVSPAGNLATGFKHRHVMLRPGANPIALTTDEVFSGAQYISFSIHTRQVGRMLRLTLGAPGMTPVQLPVNAPRGLTFGPGIIGLVESSVTMRGTQMTHVSLFSMRAPLPEGEWTASIQADAGAPVEADLYVADNKADWAGGFSFAQNDPTRTICYPSTADKTISVGAYVLHASPAFAGAGMEGQLARYSSRGPRIDGDPGIEIVAPDNPMSTLSTMANRISTSAYMPFGGTSGAGPHVAAAAALLRQLNPEAAPGVIRAALLDHARNDGFAPADNRAETGRGKLDVSAALGITPARGTPPALTLRAPSRVGPMREARMELTVMDDGPASELRARWDLDYDGTPDTPWQPVGPQPIRAGVDGFLNVRVEVRDGQGYVSATTTRIQVVPLEQVPMADRAFDPMFNMGCGCATPGGPSRGAGPWAGLALLGVIAGRRRLRAR